MKPFFTLCMVLTIIQVLSVINGVSSDTDPAPASPLRKPVRRVTSSDVSTKRDAATDVTSKTTAAKTTAAKTTPQQSAATTAAKRKAANGDQPQLQTVDNAAAATADDGPLPTDVTGAGLRLAKTVRQESSRRAADALNGGTGLLRMGGGLMDLLGGTVRRQTGNVRQVTREGFGMANGLGDSAGRGALRVMRNTAGVGRDVAGRMGEVADAKAAAGKRFSRLGGAAAVTPISMAGDAADVGAAAVTIPKNASKKVSGFVVQDVLPRLGADKLQPLKDDGKDHVEQVEEVREEEVDVDDDEEVKNDKS